MLLNESGRLKDRVRNLDQPVLERDQPAATEFLFVQPALWRRPTLGPPERCYAEEVSSRSRGNNPYLSTRCAIAV